MAQLVVMGAMAKCSFGQGPGTASITLVPNMVNGVNQTVATVQDFSPTVMSTFGMCTAPSNPQVQAAQGSPVPCVPVITGPWTPGAATVKVGGLTALTSDSKCKCSWMGIIEIQNAGQSTITTG
jgi:hypothetical protein